MSATRVSEDDIIRQLVTEIRILEGTVTALQSRLDIVRAALNETTLAHDTLDGLKNLQNGDSVLVPVGAGSYVQMTIADSKKLIMGIGADTAMEKSVGDSVEELKSRLQELDRTRTAIQQQLDQTLGRYQQDRDALEDLLRKRETKGTNRQTD
jgi:prefoldin alpha subunit